MNQHSNKQFERLLHQIDDQQENDPSIEPERTYARPTIHVYLTDEPDEPDEEAKTIEGTIEPMTDAVHSAGTTTFPRAACSLTLSKRTIFITVVLVCLIVVGGTLWWSLLALWTPSATVTLMPVTKEVTISNPIVVTTTGTATENHVPGRMLSSLKNQALRDAQSVFTRACTLGRLPVLKKPICQWNNQNWRLERGRLILSVHLAGKTQRLLVICANVPLEGKMGLLRIKKKRGKWIADIALTLPDTPATERQAVMGVDLGIKVPAVAHVVGKGTRFFGNGRSQRMMRRRFYSRRRQLQKAKKTRTIKKSKGKEARWMKDVNHKLSRHIVTYAREQGVGTIKLELLSGIRKGTTRTSRGAKARKNNRMQHTWSFYQLSLFITYKAERLGIRVEQVDPAYTSKVCPACGTRNSAQDRTYICGQCGWHGHRDRVGAINISRRAGLSGKRRGATGA